MGNISDTIIKRYQAAKTRRDQWNAILDDVYSRVAPQVDVMGTRVEGAKRDLTLFDDQGVRSVNKRAARMMHQLWPPFEGFWSFDLPGIDKAQLEGDAVKQYEAYMDSATKAVSRAMTDSNFHMEIEPAVKDILVSTCAIQVNAGDPSGGMPLVFEALPISELVPEESPRGLLENVFRERAMRRGDIEFHWKDAEIPKPREWNRQAKEDPEAKVKVLEAQIWEPETDTYRYSVILPEYDGHVLVERTYAKRRIIVARMRRTTGNLMGNGPAMDCRASMATANKVVELVLKNGSISITGIWQADDDGVINPANIKLVPGTIIPKAVGSAGLQPLAAPGRFDVSQLILADLRKNIAECIEGELAPGYDQDRPVAQAFLDAQRRQAEVEVPAHTRLFFELDQPLSEAVVDILSSGAFAGTDYHIPTWGASDKPLRPRPVNPLMQLKSQAEAARRHTAYAMAAAIDPQTTAMIVKRAYMIRSLLQDGGMPNEWLYGADQIDQLQQMIDQMEGKIQQAYAKGIADGARGTAKVAATEGGNQALQAAMAATGG